LGLTLLGVYLRVAFFAKRDEVVDVISKVVVDPCISYEGFIVMDILCRGNYASTQAYLT
jgi:hypothetical protein